MCREIPGVIRYRLALQRVARLVMVKRLFERLGIVINISKRKLAVNRVRLRLRRAVQEFFDFSDEVELCVQTALVPMCFGIVCPERERPLIRGDSVFASSQLIQRVA